MQNKFAAIAMIMIAMIGMTGFAAATQEGADVTVSIGDGNGTVTIPIIVENVTNLGYCSMKLSFNPDLVSVIDVVGVDMNLVAVSNWDAANGNVHITAFNNGESGLNGPVTVANVIFEPAEPCSMGICPLSLINTLLLEDAVGLSGTPIDHDTASGEYTTTMVNGDASGDRVVDDFDVLYIAKHTMDQTGWSITCIVVADVNGVCPTSCCVEGAPCPAGCCDETPSGDCDDVACLECCVTLSDAAYLANHLVGTPTYEFLK